MDHYHHMHQKCSLDRSSQVNLRGAVLGLKYAMSFQDAGQRDEVTPKAHISSSSSHTFSIDMMLIRDELKVWCRQLANKNGKQSSTDQLCLSNSSNSGPDPMLWHSTSPEMFQVLNTSGSYPRLRVFHSIVSCVTGLHNGFRAAPTYPAGSGSCHIMHWQSPTRYCPTGYAKAEMGSSGSCTWTPLVALLPSVWVLVVCAVCACPVAF